MFSIDFHLSAVLRNFLRHFKLGIVDREQT